MKSLFTSLLLLLLTSGCHKQAVTESLDNPPEAASDQTWVRYSAHDFRADTTLFSQPKQAGELANRSLAESSGLAASVKNPGYIWTVQDSGNGNDIQLLDSKGNLVDVYTLTGLTNQDWEEIAVGPGPIPGRSYIYVAEIGDNQLQRPLKTIYRFPEPTLKQTSGETSREPIAGIEAIQLQLPDGSKNAEAILLDPGTLDLYIISKERYSIVYRASYPQSLTHTTMMERLLISPVDYITAAAISPDGREILLRTYDELFYFTRNVGESVADALKRPPLLLPLAQESQGEGICWAVPESPNSKSPGYFTTSERAGFFAFFAQPLYYYQRR